MPDYILLMHDDLAGEEDFEAWPSYISRLKAQGQFLGGSAIGKGATYKKSGSPRAQTAVSGFIRISAASLEAARELLAGNPVYEAGGTVEIRELPEA